MPLEGRALVSVLVRLNRGPTGPALETQERLRDFAETVSAAVRDTRAVGLVGGVDDATVGVLLSLPPREDVDRALERLSAALAKRAASGRAVVAADDWVMAVGSIVSSVRDVRRAFLEAAQVADAAPSGDDGVARPYYRLPDVRLRGLLHLLRDDDRLQTFVERELGPLLAHDAQHGTDLVGVLRTYLDGRPQQVRRRRRRAHVAPELLRAAAPHRARPVRRPRLRRVLPLPARRTPRPRRHPPLTGGVGTARRAHLRRHAGCGRPPRRATTTARTPRGAGRRDVRIRRRRG